MALVMAVAHRLHRFTATNNATLGEGVVEEEGPLRGLTVKLAGRAGGQRSECFLCADAEGGVVVASGAAARYERSLSALGQDWHT